jgi:hypothetical protein
MAAGQLKRTIVGGLGVVGLRLVLRVLRDGPSTRAPAKVVLWREPCSVGHFRSRPAASERPDPQDERGGLG